MVDQDDLEEVREVVPEELTNMESLELEQKHTVEEQAREKETAGRQGGGGGGAETPKKIPGEF